LIVRQFESKEVAMSTNLDLFDLAGFIGVLLIVIVYLLLIGLARWLMARR
jgi:hypothetical protein